MADLKCICTRVGCFFALFGLVYFLESIGGTYMITAVQSIEKQFHIPSKLSGSLVSAHDIGYIPTVVILSYIGSKGNRARWIGGGCMLMALGNLIISTPNFIFPDKAVEWDMGVVDKIIEEPNALKRPDVSPKELIDYDPIRYRLPVDVRIYLERKIQGIEQDFTFKNVTKLDPRLRKSFKKVLANRRSVRQFLRVVYNTTVKSLDSKDKLMQIAASEAGYCNPILNRLKEELDRWRCAEGNTNTAAVLVICFGLIFIGIGHSMPGTLGLPLLDDNIKRKSLPVYFGLMFFIKILGPVSGFMIGSMANKFYVTLEDPVGLTPEDPRWIGAWWMGFVMIAMMLFFPSLALFLFPKKAAKEIVEEGKEEQEAIGSKNNRAKDEKGTELNLIDTHRAAKLKEEEEEGKGGFCIEVKKFKNAMFEILKNPVYAGALVGRCFDAFAFKGWFVFIPKYLDNHYGMPQYKANMAIGLLGVVGFAAGMFSGSVVMKKLKLEGRRAAGFVFICGAISLTLAGTKTFMGCTSIVNEIGQRGRENNFNFTQDCNDGCFCDPVKLLPVCSESGKIYYSPCQAGCKDMSAKDLTSDQMSFTDCSCVDVGDSVSREWCTDDCDFMIYLYFGVGILEGLIGGAAVIPGVLIILRTVPPEYRSVAFGFSAGIVSCGTWVAPIVYGFVIDTTCLLWEKTCEGTGSCSIYEPTELRWRIHILYISLRLIGLTTDVWVWYFAKDLKLMEEENVEEEEDGEEKEKVEDEETEALNT